MKNFLIATALIGGLLGSTALHADEEDALIGGIVGLALGVAIANNNDDDHRHVRHYNRHNDHYYHRQPVQRYYYQPAPRYYHSHNHWRAAHRHDRHCGHYSPRYRNHDRHGRNDWRERDRHRRWDD